MKGFRNRQKVNQNIGDEDSLVFFDDFVGNVISSLWDTQTEVAINASTARQNGIARLNTTAGDATSTLAWSPGQFDSALEASIEFRAKITTRGTSNVQMGLYKDTDEFVFFEIDTGTSDLDVRADGGTADAVDTDSGINTDTTDFHIYRIECRTDGSVVFSYDNQVVHTTAAAVVNTTVGTQFMFPRFYADDTAAATTIIDIDYVKVWQNRS